MIVFFFFLTSKTLKNHCLLMMFDSYLESHYLITWGNIPNLGLLYPVGGSRREELDRVLVVDVVITQLDEGVEFIGERLTGEGVQGSSGPCVVKGHPAFVVIEKDAQFLRLGRGCGLSRNPVQSSQVAQFVSGDGPVACVRLEVYDSFSLGSFAGDADVVTSLVGDADLPELPPGGVAGHAQGGQRHIVATRVVFDVLVVSQSV